MYWIFTLSEKIYWGHKYIYEVDKKNLPWNFIVCIKVGIAECLPKISGLYCRCLFLSKWKVLFFQRTQHCKKCPYSELFWSAFFPHFPAFRLNTERYCVSRSRYFPYAINRTSHWISQSSILNHEKMAFIQRGYSSRNIRVNSNS